MLIWTLLTYAMLMVGVAGELGGQDLWSLVVEAEKDAPHRRITPKHLFATPNHRNRTEKCQQGFRFDHMGKCVPVLKPSKIDLQGELGNWKRRTQGRKPPVTSFTSELPASSTGPYYVSIPLGMKTTTERATTTEKATTTGSPVIDFLLKTSTAVPASDVPTITTERIPSTESTSVSSTTEKGPTQDISTARSVPIESTPLVEQSNSTESIIRTTTPTVPTTIVEDSLIETCTEPPVEGSGSNVEGSGAEALDVEGSGVGLDFLVPATEVEDITTTAEPEDTRALRSTTLNVETTTEPLAEDIVLSTASVTKPSLLLSILKGDSEGTTVKDHETTTQYETTTTTTEEPDLLPIVEYIGLDFPKAIEKNKSLPMVADSFTKIQNENVPLFLEIPKSEREKPEPPKVLFFDFDKDDDFLPEEKEDASSETVPHDWIEEIPSSWVRFPDNFERRRDPTTSAELSSGPTRFRFPEEIVLPEHRPTLLKFWSKIPMYQSDPNPKKEYVNFEGF